MSYLQDQEELIERWKREQLTLKEKLVTIDKVKWKLKLDDDDNDDNDERLTLIGGVDISFPKGDDVHACACLVIISYPGLEVVYEDLAMVHLTSPYVPEFLAFREVEFLVESIKRLQQRKPDMMPQVIMVDGNGILHPRGFGIASHLGVITDIPTIGVAKNLFHVDGIEKGEEHTKQISCLLQDKGNSFPLVGKSGTTWGMALRSSKKSTTTPVCKPIYVSVGHKVSLDTAVKLVDACCRYRIPEPTRLICDLGNSYVNIMKRNLRSVAVKMRNVPVQVTIKHRRAQRAPQTTKQDLSQ
ncbi:endonuclease V isoform X2 [Nematostella vectensis]|uniref:endonuclease V isoform X2 n=1 Tax=Nematostella vectensis TaxID=45351 RepID=UPI0020773061|nr:endonuclease V isoform X2 [Nematostella vectensis]